MFIFAKKRTNLILITNSETIKRDNSNLYNSVLTACYIFKYHKVM